MEIATQILIVGGMSILAFGFLLGIPMALARSKAPRAPRYICLLRTLRRSSRVAYCWL